jgi:hypothetical protein
MRDNALIRSEFLERDLIVIDEAGIPHVEARADIRNQRLVLEVLLDIRESGLLRPIKPKGRPKRLDGRKSGLAEMRFGREARKPSAGPTEKP